MKDNNFDDYTEIECPFCGENQHMDNESVSYEEDGEYDHECMDCGKPFTVTTSVSYSFKTNCVEHDLESKYAEDSAHVDLSEYKDYLECKNCDFYKFIRKDSNQSSMDM